MAMAFTYSVLENGPRNLILHVVGVDTATTTAYTSNGSVATLVKTGASYTPTTSFKVRKIVYNFTNCAVRLQWNQDTDAEAINLTGYGHYKLTDNQGLINPKGAGSTGDLVLTAYPIAAVTQGAGVVTAMFSMTIECIKGV
jgi:hypothetical protein